MEKFSFIFQFENDIIIHIYFYVKHVSFKSVLIEKQVVRDFKRTVTKKNLNDSGEL